MLRSLNDKNAQAVMGEYAVVFFVVMAVLASMMIYFKRSVQARIRDAREYMVTEVRTRTDGYYNGNLYREYEPYYANTTALVNRSATDETTLLPGGSSGIFGKLYDESTTVSVKSVTAPPKEFNATTPVN